MCDCYERLANNAQFHFYNKEKDRLGSEFDDFGEIVWTDEDGTEQRAYIHKHLGLVESGTHIISAKELPPSVMRNNNYKINNYLVPEIRDYIRKNNLDKKHSLCKKLLSKDGCTRTDCPYDHDKSNYYCPYKQRGGCKNRNCGFSHGQHPNVEMYEDYASELQSSFKKLG